MARGAPQAGAWKIAETEEIVPLTRVRKRARLTGVPREPMFPTPDVAEDSSAELAIEPTRAFVLADLGPAAPVATPPGVRAPRPVRHAPPAQKARLALPGPELTMLHVPDGPAATQFRVLRYRIEADPTCRVVGVTGAQRGQGASSVAFNTALALAEGGRQRVAIVDLDLRHASASRMVGLGGTRGLTELLLQRRSSGFGAIPMYPVHGTLSLLTSGSQPVNCAEMLGSLALADVIQELRGAFEYILLDVPAILDFSDATLLHSIVDRFILCARAGSDGDRLRRAMARIPRDKVLGAVLVAAAAS
jgi:Mrp family chromosome partitioning ATPase